MEIQNVQTATPLKHSKMAIAKVGSLLKVAKGCSLRCSAG